MRTTAYRTYVGVQREIKTDHPRTYTGKVTFTYLAQYARGNAHLWHTFAEVPHKYKQGFPDAESVENYFETRSQKSWQYKTPRSWRERYQGVVYSPQAQKYLEEQQPQEAPQASLQGSE